MSCAVKWCKNVIRFRPDGIKFHRFPEGHLLAVWKNVLGLDENWERTSNKYVCSKHFKDSDYLQLGNRTMLKLIAVPFVEDLNRSQIPEATSSTQTISTTNVGHSEPLQMNETPVSFIGIPTFKEIPNTNKDPSPLAHMKGEYSDLKKRKIKVGKVKLKLSTQETEVCTLCLDRSKLEPVANAPLAKELHNFNFIEVEIGYKLPERICKKCLRKLNDTASFVKMCKDSLNIHIKIEEHQNGNNESDVNEKHLAIHIDSESNELQELLSETCKPVVPKEEVKEAISTSQETETELTVETCKPVVPDDKDLNESISASQETETKLTVPDELWDHLYFKQNNRMKNRIVKDNTQNQIKTCPTCGETVPGFGTHYKKKPLCRPKNIQCPMCPARFSERRRLRSHQKARHPENVPITLSMCHICSKTFKYESNLNRHLRVHKHGKRFICEQCGKGYTTAVHLRSHQNTHSNIKPFLCANCGQQFSKPTSLHLHERRCKVKISRDIKVTENELLACKICDRKFLGHGLKIHMHTHHGDKTYCRKCNTEFETTVMYRQHLKIHLKKDAMCPYCLKGYPQTGIKQHIATHTAERSFSCPECDKKFRTKVHLATHRLGIHNINRGKPLRCKYCDQTFTLRGNLRVHERIHTGEKPYSCHVCDETFADSKKRKKHITHVHGEDEVQNIRYFGCAAMLHS